MFVGFFRVGYIGVCYIYISKVTHGETTPNVWNSMSFGLVINLSSILSGVQLLWMAVVDLEPDKQHSNKIALLHYY